MFCAMLCGVVFGESGAMISVAASTPVQASPAEGSVAAQVQSITEDYGNVNTNLSWEQVFDLGLEQGSTFTISFEDKTFDVFLGTAYGDVERGEWVGLIADTGVLRLARNFENAAETLGCKVGDTILITGK